MFICLYQLAPESDMHRRQGPHPRLRRSDQDHDAASAVTILSPDIGASFERRVNGVSVLLK